MSPSASGTQAAAPAAAMPPPFKALPLLQNIDFFILGLFGLFLLTTVPRAYARYSHPSGRFRGWFLRSGSSTSSSPALPASRPVSHAEDDASDAESMTSFDMENRSTASFGAQSDGSHTLASHMPIFLAGQSNGGGAATSVNAPTRIPNYLSFTHPVICHALNYPLLPGLSMLKLLVLGIWFGIYLYAGIYRSNPFTEPKRAGFLGMWQIPFVVVFAIKNNPISVLAGVNYEKLNYLHRFAGRLMVLAVNIHFIGYLYKWNAKGNVAEEFREPFVIYGFIALLSADIIFVGSLAYVRKHFYTFFLISHIVGFILLTTFMYLHFPITLPYMATAFALYGFDHLLRMLRTRETTAYITAHPGLNGGSTRLVMPDLLSGWRAGQHVRMRLVNPEMPHWWALPVAWITARVRSRPYSISSRPDGHGLELIVKKAGRSTARLFEFAGGEEMKQLDEKKPVDDYSFSQVDVEKAGEARMVKVLVEGPYSGPSHTLFEAYSGVVLVAGGSGITYILSVLDDLLQKHPEGTSRVRVIEVVWSVSNHSSLMALLPTIRALLRPRPSRFGSLSIRMTVHYTRVSRANAPPPPDPTLLPAGVTLRPARPNFGKVLEETCDGVAAAHAHRNSEHASGVIVANCGPAELGDQVHRAIGGLNWKRWMGVGGVETVEESFAW
ncbi:hypothetical protein OF83DRAFT_1162386 [Amylostereum chailletii]|nr:hypothetical protein OF83DRAFT_1162386 [Amylostereum chailletii]